MILKNILSVNACLMMSTCVNVELVVNKDVVLDETIFNPRRDFCPGKQSYSGSHFSVYARYCLSFVFAGLADLPVPTHVQTQLNRGELRFGKGWSLKGDLSNFG